MHTKQLTAKGYSETECDSCNMFNDHSSECYCYFYGQKCYGTRFDKCINDELVKNVISQHNKYNGENK